jgi:hypothetical protein
MFKNPSRGFHQKFHPLIFTYFYIIYNITGRGRHEKKTMQFFVPAFLVASQVGWWMLALAGVSLLAIKALLVSKLALVIGTIMTVKKLFEHHHG